MIEENHHHHHFAAPIYAKDFIIFPVILVLLNLFILIAALIPFGDKSHILFYLGFRSNCRVLLLLMMVY